MYSAEQNRLEGLYEDLRTFEEAAIKAIDNRDARRRDHYGRRYHETAKAIQTITGSDPRHPRNRR